MQDYVLKEMLERLDIPTKGMDEKALLEYVPADDFTLLLTKIITNDIIHKLWAEWNPMDPFRIKDPCTFKSFRKILHEGASMGFKLGRFKDVAQQLPIGDRSERSWMSPFEAAVQDCRLKVCLSKSGFEKWLDSAQPADHESLFSKLDLMTDGLFYELGVIFPRPEFLKDDNLSPDHFRIEWNDFLLPSEMGIPEDKILVNDTVDRLTLLNVKGVEAINPANGVSCAIVSKQYQSVVEQAGLTTWDDAGYFILKLSSKMRRNAFAFVNRQLVKLQLQQLSQFFPDTVLLTRSFDTDLLVEIIRGLLLEEISVRNLVFILDTILNAQSPYSVDFSRYIVFPALEGMAPSQSINMKGVTVQDYVELVRCASRAYISHKYTRGANTMAVYLLDPSIEKMLAGKPDELQASEIDSILTAVRQEVGNLPATYQIPVILTTLEVRHRLRKLVKAQFPYLAVVSYQELSPDLNIQPIARIELKVVNYSK